MYLGEINGEGKLRSCRAIFHDVKTCFFENITPIPSQKSLWDWHFFYKRIQNLLKRVLDTFFP